MRAVFAAHPRPSIPGSAVAFARARCSLDVPALGPATNHVQADLSAVARTGTGESVEDLTVKGSGVTLDRADGVLTVTIARPEARNAINLAVSEALEAAWEELDGSADLRVAILTGAGGTFCSGMDLKAFLRGERPATPERGFAGTVKKPPTRPLIAAVEGYAVAGGFELVLACDLVVAAEDAVFGLPEVRRGLAAGGGGLLRLRERIPYHHAMELALTGRSIDAVRAYELGLVNQVVPTGTALKAAHELAATISANGPLAVAASKQVIVESRDWSQADGFDKQMDVLATVIGSADAQEGARAFAEKRMPVWQGR
jgi:enoyl-CoA hydratase